MYLKHLIHSRGITVHDARSNKVVFWADESIVRECIRAGKVKAEGQQRCIRRLVWIGRELSTVKVIEEEFGTAYAPSRSRGPKKYSHNRERTSTEEHPVTQFDENIQGVWTMVRLPNSTQIVYLAVAAQCGARIFERKSNLAAKPSYAIPDAFRRRVA